MESIGLGGILSFESSAAVQSMRAASAAFQTLTQRANAAAKAAGAQLANALRNLQQGMGKIAAGTSQFGRAVGAGTLAATPLAVGLGVAANQAASFEKQMSAVQAVMLADADTRDKLIAKAKLMGATTVFTATEAGQAMEYLARAGATTAQVMDGVDGVMNAAAADGMGLAEAADIIAQAVKGMGLEFSEAGKVADILAVASAKSNTNIAQLGYALSYSTGAARTMGIDIAELSSILGKAADAGLQGSMGGTSFVQMMAKLQKPTKEGAALISKWGIQMTDATGKLLPMGQIVDQFKTRIDAIPDAMERTRVMTELFGIRGQKAFAALSAAGGKAIDELTQTLRNAEGGAKRMAEIRLDNFLGQITLLKSATEGFIIELFGPILKAMTGGVKSLAEGLGRVVATVQRLKEPLKEGWNEAGRFLDVVEEFGSTTANVAAGVMDAVRWVQAAWGRLVETIKSVAGVFASELGGEGVRSLTKIAVVAGIVIGAITPIAASALGFAFVLTTVVIPAVKAVGAIVAGVFTAVSWPLLAAIAAIVVAFAAFRREGESIADTFRRAWGLIASGARSLWEGALKPLVTGFRSAFGPALEDLKAIWLGIVQMFRDTWNTITSVFTSGSSDMVTDWKAVGEIIGAVFGALATTIGVVLGAAVQIVTFLITQITLLGQVIGSYLIDTFRSLWGVIKTLGGAFVKLFKGDISGAIHDAAMTLLKVFMLPITNAAKMISKIGGKLVPQFVHTIANWDVEAVTPQMPAPTTQKATESLNQVAAQRGEAAAPELTAEVKIEDKRCVEVNNKIQVDGREIAHANAKHQKEISERNGWRSTPWQRRLAAEHGAVSLVP